MWNSQTFSAYLDLYTQSHAKHKGTAYLYTAITLHFTRVSDTVVIADQVTNGGVRERCHLTHTHKAQYAAAWTRSRINRCDGMSRMYKHYSMTKTAQLLPTDCLVHTIRSICVCAGYIWTTAMLPWLAAYRIECLRVHHDIYLCELNMHNCY